MREAHLRDLIAVLESGSVRAAARRLQITQGAVSKNLAALERTFGVPLLVRSTHGVEPTEFGRILLRRARLADIELKKAQEEIAARLGEHHGSVSIGLSSTAEALLAAPAICKFRAARPDTLVSIQGGNALTMVGLLREGRLDFAVGTAAPALVGADLRSERLLSSDLVVVARHGHPRARTRELTALADCEWILGARPGDIEPAVVSAFQEAGLPLPRFAVQRDSFSALIFLLQQTDYVAVTSLPAVEPFLREGLLARLPVQRRFAPMVQYLVTSAVRPLKPSAQALAAEFRKAARGQRR